MNEFNFRYYKNYQMTPFYLFIFFHFTLLRPVIADLNMHSGQIFWKFSSQQYYWTSQF